MGFLSSIRQRWLKNWSYAKVGFVFAMIVVFMLHHAEFGPNDHQEDAPYYTFGLNPLVKHLIHSVRYNSFKRIKTVNKNIDESFLSLDCMRWLMRWVIFGLLTFTYESSVFHLEERNCWFTLNLMLRLPFYCHRTVQLRIVLMKIQSSLKDWHIFSTSKNPKNCRRKCVNLWSVNLWETTVY